MSQYVDRVLAELKEKNAHEAEFLQTAEEVLSTLGPVVDAHPEYEKAALLERMVEPERTIEFRVPWVDDNGQVHVNRGYRVQFNGAIGPYKGGLRFAPSVNLSIMKFLGFEQTFKNSLTTLPMGGAKGGSDFDPNGKSDAEVMRFCQSFMTELYRHIGPDVDIPAGDLGVGAREIGYMYGQYRKIRGAFENGTITGKGMSFGGSLIRPEATGYGAVYYVEAVMKHENDTLEGKTVALAGFGNVAWGAATKATELGAKVITISGPDGYIYDPDGISGEKIDYMLELRASGNDIVAPYAEKYPGATFVEGKRPWEVKADIALPCATQNEIHLEDAETMVANGCKYLCEGSNMPTTNEALKYLMDNGVVVGPSKAANAGGVACSCIEMGQNAGHTVFSPEQVYQQLETIMVNIHKNSAEASERYGLGYNLVAGANIAGFEKVAQAMMAQGLV